MIYKPVRSQEQIDLNPYSLTLSVKISRINPLWRGVRGWKRFISGSVYLMPIDVGAIYFPTYQSFMWKRGDLPTFNLSAVPPSFTCLELNLILIE